MRVWTMAMSVLLAMTVSACQLLGGGGTGRDVTQHFDDALAQELARAVSSGDRDGIRDLVAAGSPVDAVGKEGVTMLQWAVFEGQHGALSTLLDLGADVEQHGLGGSTVLHTAAQAPDVWFLDTLLETGVDPDLRHAVTEETPLQAATGMGTDENFRLLLKHDADVRLADRNRTTALHLAAMLNAGSQVLALLDRGADPLAVDRVGATFQDYFWTTNPDIMHDLALRERRTVADWLTARDIPLHEDAAWERDSS